MGDKKQKTPAYDIGGLYKYARGTRFPQRGDSTREHRRRQFKCGIERARETRKRDDDGKFAAGGGKHSNEQPEDIAELLGEEFKGVKGQQAVDKLMHEKRGHVKGAFHREDIGDIDLIWGDDTCGLQHILSRREEQGINAREFVQDLAEVVEKGQYRRRNDRGNFEFLHGRKMAVISPELRGNKLIFLVTAFKTRREPR